MPESLLILAAGWCALLAAGWLALSDDSHWHEVFGKATALSAGTRRSLRWRATTACLTALCLALAADHASMAVLVWIMLLSGSALIIALTLSWRPDWLYWLQTPQAP